MAASNIYDTSRLLNSLTAPEYNADALRAMNDSLTAREALSREAAKSLENVGTNVLNIGTGIQKSATDQLKYELAKASQVDPTGNNLVAILDRAKSGSDNATGFDMAGMVDFPEIDAYQKELGNRREIAADRLRKAAAEKQLRRYDEFEVTKRDYENKRLKQQMEIAQYTENRNQLTHELNQEKAALELAYTEENNELKVRDLTANIKKKEIALKRYDQQLVDKRAELLANTESTGIDTKKKKRIEKKAEERQLHEDLVDTQIIDYNAAKSVSPENGWTKLQEIIQNNYQKGVAQPRLLELANQHLANSFDPTDGILDSELAALKGNRSSFAKTKLLNTISKRLKAKYTGLIPALGNSKGLAATIKAQAESVIDNYIDPTTKLALGEEFKKESLYAKRTLPQLLKNEVDDELASVQDTMEALRVKHAKNPNDPTATISAQISALDKAKLKLTQLVDDKGSSLVNTRAAEKLLQPIRDRLLGQRNDLLGIESFKITTTNSQGKSIERPLDLMKDLGISRLDLSLGKNPQARELASFTTFESKLASALARDSRLYNTSKEARALKKNQILNSISGYSTVKLDATKTQSAKDLVEQVKIQGPKLQEEAKQKFMVSFRTNKFPSADIAKQLIQNFPTQYDKDNIDSEAVSEDVEITYNNMKELYKNQWAHIDEPTGRILGIKNQDALDDLGYAVYRLYSGAEGKPRGTFDSSQEITSGSIPETSIRKNMILGLPLGRWSTLEERISISELSEDDDVFASIIQRSGVFPKARYKPSTAEEINKKAANASKVLNPPTASYQLP